MARSSVAQQVLLGIIERGERIAIYAHDVEPRSHLANVAATWEVAIGPGDVGQPFDPVAPFALL